MLSFLDPCWQMFFTVSVCPAFRVMVPTSFLFPSISVCCATVTKINAKCGTNRNFVSNSSSNQGIGLSVRAGTDYPPCGSNSGASGSKPTSTNQNNTGKPKTTSGSGVRAGGGYRSSGHNSSGNGGDWTHLKKPTKKLGRS